MTVYGGAARDLLRNLPALAEVFEVRFACLNLRDSQRTLIESMGIEVLCPEQQWQIRGGLLNEINAGQERSAEAAWRTFSAVHEAIEWADAIHLTGGNGSMEFPQFVPAEKPLHLHFLESKPGIHDDVSHLKPNGSGGWKPRLLHLLQGKQRRRIEASFQPFGTNTPFRTKSKWEVSANSAFSASNLKRIYGIDGGVLYPSVDLSEFPREASSGEAAAFDSAGREEEGVSQYAAEHGEFHLAGSYAFTIGRISRFKGSHETIDHLTGSGLDLVVVGAGSWSEVAALKAYGKSRGVDVKVLNGLGSETLRAIMRNAAAVIGLAHGEAFGLTPIEAMALGVPPLFVDEGGYRETVVDGVNGRLLKRGDMASWSTALDQARNPDIRNEWAAAGLARIEELGLTPQHHAARLKAIIGSLL